VVLAFVLLSSSTIAAHADADHAAIAKASLEQYIRPGYAQFAESTDALKQSVAALCEKPSAAALKDTEKTFAAAVEAWSIVEPIRFGPVAQEHRFERIFYWPDPKGLGARQVREALAKEDKSVMEASSLTGKSVALQGLPALEYLLYGDGAATLTKTGGDGAFRCRFAEAIAGNLATMSKEVVDGWQDGAPYAKSYLEPGPANAAYHAPKEVTLELFKTFTAGIEWVRDQKLAKTLGAKPDQARPQLAPFWRSGLSFANMAGNLVGVRDLFAKGGFAQVVHQESAGVEDSVVFDLDHAIEVLRGMDKPIAEAVRNEELRAKLEALRVSLKAASTTAGDMISRGAGLTFGFNAMDGD
jgi:predicted lipoprotein